MPFSAFIRDNLDSIVSDWEAFARTLPAAHAMSTQALRDHCREILLTIVADMDTVQTAAAQSQKSKDIAPHVGSRHSAAETHGTLRQQAGFDLVQLVAEFRAMRASVLSLWQRAPASQQAGIAVEEITRFNEGIDQALAESVERFSANLAASRDMFLGVLGHDLRGPLSGIAMSNMLLARAELAPSDRLKASARIARAIKEMNRLIADLLDYTSSRLGTGIPIEAQPCDLAAVCRDALDSAQASHLDQAFELHIDGDLNVQADAAKVGQALGNLLLNGVQHGDRHSPVVLTAAADGDAVVITVLSHGQAIDAASLARLFEPMTRFASEADPSERSRSSMGLGLFIVREIVDGHAGDVAVTSSAEAGTLFTVRLPRHGGKRPESPAGGST